MAYDDLKPPKSPFRPFGADDWAGPTQPKSGWTADEHESIASSGAAQPTTDWGNVAGAGIGAAGQTAGALAEVAAHKYAMDQQMNANNAARMLSEKLAKMQIAASQEQYEREQNLRALLWALNANKGQQAIGNGARDVRRGAFEGMDDLLAKVMLKRS